MTEAIKGLFRDAVIAVTRRYEDELPPKVRRRSGEAEGAFQRLARKVSRRFDVRREFRGRAAITSRSFAIDAEAVATATAYLSGTLDMLNQLNDDPLAGLGDGDFADDFDAVQNHISPHL